MAPSLTETGTTTSDRVPSFSNVRRSVALLAQVPEAHEALVQKKFCLRAAIYELLTGHVRFLDG